MDARNRHKKLEEEALVDINLDKSISSWPYRVNAPESSQEAEQRKEQVDIEYPNSISSNTQLDFDPRADIECLKLKTENTRSISSHASRYRLDPQRRIPSLTDFLLSFYPESDGDIFESKFYQDLSSPRRIYPQLDIVLVD